MIFIIQKGQEINLHIGSSAHYISAIEPENVTEVQADGHELEQILTMFGNTIPQTKERVQSWFGDTAKTIAKTFKQKNMKF